MQQFWRDQIERQAASEHTVRDWRRQERLSEPSFYGWRSELAKRDRPRATVFSTGDPSRAICRHLGPKTSQSARRLGWVKYGHFPLV